MTEYYGDLTSGSNFLQEVYPKTTTSQIDFFNNWTYPFYTNCWCGCNHDKIDKIDLKLSEVNKLRTIAKKDKKIRDILNKLAPAIKLEVDFDE